MSITRKKLNNGLIFLFVFITTLMPAQSYAMKEIFLGLVLLSNIDRIIIGFARHRYIRVFGFFLPLWLFSVSILAGGSLADSIKGVYFFTFIWIVEIAISDNINLKEIFLNVTLFMAILINCFVLFHASHIMPLQSNPVARWLTETGNAQLSYGSVALFYYVFYLNACPLMLFTLVDSLQTGKKIRTVIVLLALMFSGTRANVYFGFMCVIGYILVYMKNDWKKHLLIICGGCVMLVAIKQLLPTIQEKINTINSVKSFGDDVRSGRTQAAIREIFGSWKVFLIGMGANIPFKANGIQNYSSEMSYIEIWRIFGGISLILILCMLVYLIWKNRKNAACIAFCAYLITCAVDPFLMTSTGFLMIMYMFYLSRNSDLEKKDVEMCRDNGDDAVFQTHIFDTKTMCMK